jgi:hypothetical protein
MEKTKRLPSLALILVLIIANFSFFGVASATTYLTKSSIVESSMTASSGTSLALSFKTSASGGGTSLIIAFSSGTVATTQPVTNGCTGFGSLAGANVPGTPAATGSGSTITFSGITAYAASTQYCVTLSSATALTNPAASTFTATVTAGNDVSTLGLDSISNNSYVVSATVAPTFTMSLPSTTDALGTLSSTAYSSSTGVTATVTTNAVNGWFLWAKDTNAGLTSANAGYTIPTVPTTSNANMSTNIGSPFYALGVTTSNATTNYADTGGSTGGGLSASTYNEVATASTATASSTVTLKELADISGTTAPGNDYTDTITVVGAGSF